MTNNVDMTVFVSTLDARIEKESSATKVFGQYLLFFLYFFNITDLRSILKLYP
ncbi:MAG: hypothetical protein PHG08_03785 [Bacilli bacterium]|nr:hypothetical protein [Bacilli bacterium]HHU24547.1 hypothetical protein [Acholeplasmataceae bacterium]